MKKDEILSKLKEIDNKYPQSYNSLCTVSKILRYIAIIVFIFGAIGAIITWTEIGFISFITTITSICSSAGILYAISAGLNGLADVVLNTKQNKDLIMFKIAYENGLFNKSTSTHHQKENNNTDLLIYKDEIVKITYTGIKESLGGTDLKLNIENLSDKVITVQPWEVYVNKIISDPILDATIQAGKNINTEMIFSHLEKSGIDKIKTIELSFHIFDTDSRDTILDTNQITIDLSK